MAITILLLTIATALLVLAAVRVVPAHERAVIFRFGRYARTQDPGLVLIIPGVEKFVTVTNRERRAENIVTMVTTRDDVSVEVWASARFRVVDPLLSTVSVADVYTDTVLAVEAALRNGMQHVDLRDLVQPSPHLLDAVVTEANGAAAAWGVIVQSVEILGTEVKVSADLMRWAEHQSGDADLQSP